MGGLRGDKQASWEELCLAPSMEKKQENKQINDTKKDKLPFKDKSHLPKENLGIAPNALTARYTCLLLQILGFETVCKGSKKSFTKKRVVAGGCCKKWRCAQNTGALFTVFLCLLLFYLFRDSLNEYLTN